MKCKFLFLIAACMVLVGCNGEKEVTETPVTATVAPTDEPTTTPEPTETPVEEGVAGVAEFRGIAWERDSGHDIETLKFMTNGSFRYYCACGNPVNDSDACESYDYNPETGMITLNCFEEIEEMVTEIKVISCDGSTLVLDFAGDIRTFTKE